MNATLPDLFVLALRLWLGLNVALAHGWPKLTAPADFIGTAAQDFWLPAVSGWFAILAEFVGGCLLALGMYTRTSSLCIAVVFLVSATFTHSGEPWLDARELRYTLAFLALFFAVHGSGPLSLDAALERRRRKRSPW